MIFSSLKSRECEKGERLLDLLTVIGLSVSDLLTEAKLGNIGKISKIIP